MLKNLVNPIIKIAIAIFLFFGEQLLASLFLVNTSLNGLIISLSSMLALSAASIGYIIWHHRKYKDQTVRKFWPTIRIWIYGLFAIIVCTFVTNVILLALGKSLHMVNAISQNQQVINKVQHVNIYGTIFIIVLTLVVGPIIEEMTFRYIPTIGTKHPRIWLFAFGILFVLAHLADDLTSLNLANPTNIYLVFTHAVTYLVPTIVFTLIYTKTKNIANSMAVHALGNVLSILI